MESYYMNMSKSDCFAADGHLGSCKKVGFPGGSADKNNPPAMQETPVRLLGQKIPLEKG